MDGETWQKAQAAVPYLKEKYRVPLPDLDYAKNSGGSGLGMDRLAELKASFSEPGGPQGHSYDLTPAEQWLTGTLGKVDEPPLWNETAAREEIDAAVARTNALLSRVQQREDIYNMNPTQQNLELHKQANEAYEAQALETNRLLAGYTYYNTPEGMVQRHGALLTRIETDEAALKELHLAAKGVSSLLGPEAQAAIEDEIEALTARIAGEKQEMKDLADARWMEDHRRMMAAVSASPELSQACETIKNLDRDIERINALLAYQTNPPAGNDGGANQSRLEARDLARRYGLELPRMAGGGVWRNNPVGLGSEKAALEALAARLKGERGEMEQTLKAAGYDYAALEDYEKKAAGLEKLAQAREMTEQFARDHPVVASLSTIPLVPLQMMDYFLTSLSGLGRSDPRDLEHYVPADTSSMEITNFVSTVRGTVSRQIEENTDWELFGQNVWSFL